MSVDSDGTVRHEVVVDLPQDEAFWTFTDLDQIKPREHNMLAVPIEQTVLEQRVGGDVYDRGVDGSICRWGRVIAFDPPHTLAFSWDIGPDWQVASDLSRTSEVEVTFTAEGSARTRVTLTHRHLDRHGDGWETMRDGVDAPDGWPLYLARYHDLTRGEPGARMTRPDLMTLAEEERTELLALLRSLTTPQWEAQSLCTHWRVRDVALHVVSYDELSKTPARRRLPTRRAARRARVNAVALNRYDDLEPDDIIDLLERNLRPRGLTSGFGGGIALTDGTIHHQDIRRALGLPRTIPASRLTAVLDFALSAPTLPAKRNTKGLKLVATDVDWCTGQGPEVTGPGEALLMAAAGRPAALHELDGPGLPQLTSRIR